MPAPDPLALLRQYLQALADPSCGERFHGLHASDAVLRHAEGVRPAAQVPVAPFARAHRELNERGAALLPRFQNPQLLTEAAGTEGGAITWFTVLDASAAAARGQEPRTLIGALGWRLEAGHPRVGWCTLAERAASWSYQEGRLQTLADYPWMRTDEPTRSRATLDAAYFRRHWRSAVTFTTLPGARFGCQMSTACCKHDFEITVPAEAQLLIDAMPWGTLSPDLSGTQLPVRADGTLQLKLLNETCRFLGARRQCLIHQQLGRQPFGACAVFPYAFARTPEGIAVSLSPICGSVRLGLGGGAGEREADLRERLVQARPRQTEVYRLAPAKSVPWEGFRDIERGLHDCLAAEQFPLRTRLLVGSRLLGALGRDEPVQTERWLAEPPAPISPELRAAIHGLLGKILAWDRAALRALPKAPPTDLAQREAREPAILARVLQNVLYAKVYSYPYDLTTAHNFLVLLYLLTLAMEAASQGPLSATLWQELGSLGVHGLLLNVLHEGVPEGFIALFGTAEFGQWALAA